MTKLQIVRFQGTARGFVAYLIKGKDVYFSGLCQTMSTINSAEPIILKLAEIAGHSWKIIDFYDVRTHNGYARIPLGEYIIERLEMNLHSRKPRVEHWVPVAASSARASLSFTLEVETLPGIDEDVLEEFMTVIENEVQR